MKKIIYMILLFLVSVISITSCTEQEIEPATNTANSTGGGGTSDDPLHSQPK